MWAGFGYFEPVWVSLGQFGLVWASSSQFGPVWVNSSQFGLVWSSWGEQRVGGMPLTRFTPDRVSGRNM